MTYKTAYKELSANGAIDSIINGETLMGEDLNHVNVEIIEAIHYFLDFVKDGSFKRMQYWYKTPENM